MTISIIATTLLSIFATTGTPNLCDDVYLDADGSPYRDWLGQTLARYCQWTGPDAPVWDKDVCCTIDEDGAHCSATDRKGRCRVGLKMHCEYGEAVFGGGVICYQRFPSMCDAGLCVRPPDTLPPGDATHLGCCSSGGVCQLIYTEDVGECQGYYLGCNWGELNADGTIDCYD